MSAQHTPGPWYWHIDDSGRPSLRTPDRGQLIVMDFGRKGMQGAQPRFAEWPGIYSGVERKRLGGILVDASHWFSPESGINHPDARLIAAAPELLAELQNVLRCSALPETWAVPIRAAIAKATGSAA